MTKINDVFGKLTVIECSGKDTRNNKIWLCKCDCGKFTSVRGNNLTGGKIKSCGCLRKNNGIVTHGFYKENKRLYACWKNMLTRCENVKFAGFKYWGGKGVKVCFEWHDYINFKKWSLENGYSENLTLDRIYNYGNYGPENCRWTTWEIQNRNKSNFRLINGVLRRIN
jgi:hypothetical protein